MKLFRPGYSAPISKTILYGEKFYQFGNMLEINPLKLPPLFFGVFNFVKNKTTFKKIIMGKKYSEYKRDALGLISQIKTIQAVLLRDV